MILVQIQHDFARLVDDKDMNTGEKLEYPTGGGAVDGTALLVWKAFIVGLERLGATRGRVLTSAKPSRMRR